MRLVAVELYASWCKPCVEAAPRWEALARDYRDAGLRVVLVATEDPGGCESPPWRADHLVCDRDGSVAAQLGADGRLPAAYLYSWRGETLVGDGHIDEVEAAIGRFYRAMPRVHVEARTVDPSANVTPETLVGLVRGELSRSNKMMVVATPEERARLDRIAAESLRAGYDDSLQCEIGRALSANSLLEVWLSSSGAAEPSLQLLLFSAERGCLVSSGLAPWNAERPEASVRRAVAALEAEGTGPPRAAAPPPPPPPLVAAAVEPPAHPNLPWIIGGTGAAAVTLGVVLGVTAKSMVDDTRAAPHRDAALRLDRAKKVAASADGLMISGALLTAIGVYLWADQ